jgi:hypothetical protein
MGDDITIGVTEVVNNIEVTAQPNDQIIDIDVIDNSDSVTLNVTPTLIEVNIERGGSFARWGTIYGSILDQTDLQNALFNKADLVNGLVPASQLPSFVDDVIEVANFASLPTSGEIGKIYITLDNNKIYRWGGSTYVEIAANNAVWGAITGTLSNQTDLQNALNAKQATLVSGTNIKTLEGQSLLGSGNIDLSKSDVGLGNVDNTSDANKPISSATQTALDLKANISGQVFTGAISATNLSGTNTGDQDLSGLVPNTRTLTINGVTFDLSANRSWSINALPSMFEFNETDKTMWNNGKANIASNTSYGDGALIGSSAGTDNTAIGYRALFSNSFQGAGITAIGSFALTANTTGSNNTAIGNNALVSNLTGSNTIAIGQQSGQTYQNISTSIFIGNQTSASGESQTNQIVIGHGATGNGSNSVTLGNTSITRTFLRGDVSIGTTSLIRTLSVNNSTGVYSGAFSGGASGNYVGLGVNTLVPTIQGFLSGNSVANLSLQPDGGNLAIGMLTPSNFSGYTNLSLRAKTSGINLDFFDNSGVRRSSIIYNNQVDFTFGVLEAIPFRFETSGVERMRIAANGNVGIGTTTTNGRLRVLDSGVLSGLSFPFEFASSNTSLSGWLFAITNNNTSGLLLGTRSGSAIIGTLGPTNLTFNPDGGSVTVGSLGTGTVFSNGGVLTNTPASDERLKDDIEDLEYGLNEILKLRPVSYNWKNDNINQGKQFGFIAQEVQEIMPDLIKEFTINEDEEEVVRLGLEKEGIYAALVNAVKEQNEVLVKLKAEIDLLKQKA